VGETPSVGPEPDRRVDAVLRLRSALATLDEVVGPRLAYATVLECANAVVGVALLDDPAAGRRVVADALRSARWQVSLPALAVIEPAVVLAIGTDFLADAARRTPGDS
jgi:hypothetical protein